MLDGPAPDIGIRLAPPRVEVARPPQNFTPLPEFGRSIITEPQKYGEPITTVLPQDKELTDKLLAQIMNQKVPKNPQEVVSQIEKKIPQEVKKSQGFWAQLITAIQDFFRNIFR